MFDPDKIYVTDDPQLLTIARKSTLATWRCRGRGPPYVKLGSRVGYFGRDLNEWLLGRIVRPAMRPAPPAA